MKANLFSMAAAAIMIAGCTESAVENPIPVSGGGDIVVHASVLNGTGTRTAFGDESDGVMNAVWSENDRILVRDNSSVPAKSAVYILKDGAGESSGIFTFEEGDALSSMTDVTYPASAADASIPAEQTYTAGTYDPEAAVLTWHSDTPEPLGGTISLENTASIICISLTGNETVESVSATLASGNSSAVYTLVSEAGVTLSGTPTPFYIAVPGSDAEYGLSISVNSMYGAEPLVQKTGSPRKFQASALVRFPALAYNYAGALYAPGDYWPDEENAEGIVFTVSDGGRHGKVISIYEKQGQWGPAKSEAGAGVAGMRVEPEDGRLITRSIIEKYKDTETFAADYPCFEWIYNTVNKGDIDGPWYAPVRQEVAQWAAAMSGFDWNEINAAWKTETGGPGYCQDKLPMPGWLDDEAKTARDAFNKKVEAAGGDTINLWGKYCSTWENSSGSSVFRFNITTNSEDGGQYQVISKTEVSNRIRPVRTF